MLLVGGGEAKAALSCGGPAYGVDKFYTPPANCDATSAGADGFWLNQTQSGSPGAWIVSLFLNNPTGSQRTFTCTSTSNGCGGSPGYSNSSFFASISAACSTGTGDCTMTYTYTNSSGLVTVTYYIAAGTNYIASTSISGGGFDGPSTRMLLGSSKSPSNLGDAVTLTARLTGYGALGIGGGNVDLSSSIDGSLGSVALDTLGGVSAVAGGTYHTCAVTSAGGVKCWGHNASGQLGDGTATQRTTPVDVVGLSSGVVAVTSGGFHSCALTSAGGVKCWGYNAYGQIGDGTSTDRLTPVNVSGLTSGVVAISAGYEHTCAVLATGESKCWGWNQYGQLGDGTTTTPRYSPVSVLASAGGANLSGIVAISASYLHTCALTSAGGVKCWGRNSSGQIGDNSALNTVRLTPVDVTGLTSGVASITTLIESSCALTTGGGAKCWGWNGDGQLGNGSTTLSLVPVDVSGLTGATAISGGHSFTCALTSANGAKCWGLNNQGQLGDGTTTTRTSPVSVSTLSVGAGALSITTGESHACAVIGGATVKCWGYNGYGQVGDGTLTNRTTPTSTPGIATALLGKATLTTSSLVRGFHTITASYDGDGAGTIFAPANATVSQQVVGSTVTTAATSKSPATQGDSVTLTARVVGYGNGFPTGNVNFSSSINGALGSAALERGESAIAPSAQHTCVLTSSGGVRCWGYNGQGQLGDGTTTNRTTAGDVVGLGGVVALEGGLYHTCALTQASGVKCWGRNTEQQLGDGTLVNKLVPTDVTGLTGGVAAISAGGLHTCALTVAGGVKCWGYNGNGQLGDGTTTNRSVAVDVSGLTRDVVAIASGGSHTCALTQAGGVKCWGYNFFNQLGDGTGTDRAQPVDVVGFSSGVKAIAAGDVHNCLLTTGGGMKCWGRNSDGRLGDGTTIQRATPTDVSTLTSGVLAIAAGNFHTCAMTGGGIKCWGFNGSGQLGDGTTTTRSTPTAVVSLPAGTEVVAVGPNHTCAVHPTAGATYCWGLNGNGQIGDGTTTNRSTPTTVSGVSAALIGAASLTTSSLSAGSHTVTTAYAGDANHNASNGTVSQQVNPPPPPVVISNSPSSGPIAGGNAVTITGTNFTGATSVRFDTTEALFTVDSDTQITATAPAHAAGIIDITVTTPYGWSQVDSGTLYTYVAPPTVTALSPNAGPLGGGTTVVVTGTNLSGATAVTFGGTPASGFTVNSATSITATAPAGAGTVDVRVTTVGGTSATSAADQFTYVAAPVVTAISPTAGPAAGGTSVTITGTSLSGATAVTFGATPATGFTVNSATQITATAPAGTGTVDVRVTTAGGASATSAADQFTYIPVPTLASVSPTSGPTTGNTSVTITGTNFTGASAVTFGGTNAQSYTVDSATQITATTPAHGAGSVDVAVTTTGGTATSTGAFTYQLSPTALLVGTAKTPVYQTQPATFTARVTAYGGGAPTGNVNFSSSIDGAIGAAALDVYGGNSTLAGGDSHSCMLTNTGGVKCWGNNGYGQLGDNTTISRLSPVDVSGLTTGAVAVVSGAFHSCALTQSGGVKCWGFNTNGQLGNNSTASSSTPVDVTGLTSGVVSLTAGAFHVCALTSSGAVKCWGWNPYGQLGNGTNTDSTVAVDVVGLSNDVIAVGAGHYHTCALNRTGGLKCWGSNTAGQLGDGTTTDRNLPVEVSGLTSGVVSIGNGYHVHYTCALTSGGGVKCWGLNADGQLGDGSTTNRSTPVDVIGMTSGVQAISGGAFHSCAITGAGSLYCWGRNANGQLGNGTTDSSVLPVAVNALSGVLSVAGGNYHTCAAFTPGNVACWGMNNAGQIGDGTTTQRLTRTNVSGVSPSINARATLSTSVLSGVSHTITAAYAGDGNHATSNNTVAQDVIGAPTVTSISPVVGPTGGGTSVTVTGTNFTGASGVTFGGNAATTFTVDSATQITATAPAGSAGTVDVVVTTPAGSSATGSADQFTYVAAPVVTAISPTAGPTAGGTSVTVTGTGFTGASAVTFGASGALSFSVNSDTQITALAPSGTGTVDVRVTTVGGTSATSAADQFTYVPAPTVTALSPTAGPVAGGTSVNISGTNLVGASAVMFGANAATGFTVNSATSITATAPAGTGTVDVRVTTVGGTSATGAPDEFTYVAMPTLASVAPSSGATVGGTSVVIAGTNLSGANNVTFGGIAAQSFTVDSATQITAVTPPHAVGSVAVAVTTTGGTATSSGVYTYQLSPTALLVGTAKTPVYQGQSATFTARITAYGGGAPTGNVNFSSSLGGAIGSAALDAFGGGSAVAQGDAHTCILTEAGEVKCSGDNGFGQLGDGTTTRRLSPVDVSGLSGGVVAIASGLYHSCALTSGGGVKCWGYNDFGQLGDGTTTSKTSPVNVAGLSSGVVAIVAGGYHTCALTAGGQVKCWGWNDRGQLGDGTVTQRQTPTDVLVSPGGAALDSIVSISGGYFHTCALTSAGGVKCWGENSSGQLGDGTTTNRPSPTGVSGLSGGIAKIFAGWMNSCVITTSGAAKCWGNNDNYQIGDGTNVNRTTPVDVSGLGSGVASIANGYLHGCALLTSGGMKCWGDNGYGQLGDGTTNNLSNPTDVSGLTSGVASISAGSLFTCAVLNAGGVKCWGAGDSGQLGNGGTSHRSTPTNVPGLTAAFLARATISTTSLSAGSHTITASYAGDGNHATGNNTVAQDVIGAPTVSLLSPTAGPATGGTSVVLTGTNFTGATGVAFGGTAATAFTLDSATQITATSPAHSAGTVDVVVTTPAGASATGSADQFAYIGAPTLASVSPNAGPTAGGASVTITGTSLATTSAVTFDGVAASFTVDSDTQITAVTPAHATGSVDVAVTTVGGTATVAGGYTYVVAPTLASVLPASGPVTGGTSVTLTGTGLTGASSVTFGGVAATSVSVVSATTVSAVTPAHAAGAVDVAVTTAGGAATLAGGFTYTNGSLQVSGAGNMIALGPQGGPFNPASFSYLLKSSAGPLNWQLSGVPDWLTVSPGTSGSTDATGITVTFTTNTNATTKAVGTYGLSTIAFTNTDNGQGNTTRSAGLTVSPKACEVVARGPEFNGDGKGDILWRSDAGAIGMWFMNGTALSSGPGLGTISTDWRLIGAADFNGDGKSDLLWRNRTSGQVAVWFISGVTVTGTTGLGTVGADWQIVGAADFDGDHVADILWRHDTGTLALWHGTGGTGQSRTVIGSVDMSWRIAGLGDFDGDGKSDILWRSTSGVVAVWLMNGDLMKGSASFGAVPSDWRIAGVGDFNGDGKADILWRQDAGVVALWFINGTTLVSSGGVGTIAADWHIAGTNDYNGDGKADLLWRQDNGSLGVWLMNGASVTSSGGVSGVGYDWHVVNGEHDRPVVLIQPGPC